MSGVEELQRYIRHMGGVILSNGVARNWIESSTIAS